MAPPGDGGPPAIPPGVPAQPPPAAYPPLQTEDPEETYLRSRFRRPSAAPISQATALQQTEAALGPAPTPPTSRPSKLQNIIAAGGDIFSSLGQLYQGAHPRSVRPGTEVQQTHYYQTLQDRYKQDKEKYDQDVQRRGMITAQMVPSLMSQSRETFQAAEHDKLQAAIALLEQRTAAGKVTRDPDNLMKLLDGYASSYVPHIDPKHPMATPIGPEVEKLDGELDSTLAHRFPDMQPKERQLAILSTKGKATLQSPQALARLASVANMNEGARKNRIMSDWQERYSGMPVQIQNTILAGKMADVREKFKMTANAVTNIGKIGDPNVTNQIWRSLLEEAGIPEELAGLPPAIGAAGGGAGAAQGLAGGGGAGVEEPSPDEQMGDGTTQIEQPALGPGEQAPAQVGGGGGGAAGGVALPPQAPPARHPATQQPANPAAKPLPPERIAELKKLATDLKTAIDASDIGSIRRFLLKVGYPQEKVLRPTIPSGMKLADVMKDEAIEAIVWIADQISAGPVTGPVP